MGVWGKKPEVGSGLSYGLAPRFQQIRNSDTLVAWRLAPCHPDESVRWECVDGRWVAIALGFGATAGIVLVMDSAGRCESVDSYEDALTLAKRWRTATLVRF